LASAGALRAQTTEVAGPTRHSVELGVDAQASFGLDDPKVTTVDIPAARFRIGFVMTPNISFEPVFGLSYIHFSGANLTQYQALLGMLYHFEPDTRLNQLYVRPFFGMVGVSGSGNHTTQAELGAGLGIKVPLTPRVSARFETNYQHAFSSGDSGSSNAIALLAGLSLFAR